MLETCSSPGLALSLLFCWFVLGVFSSFSTAVAWSFLRGKQSFLDEFNRDEMRDFDRRLEMLDPDEDELSDEALAMQLKGGTRFGITWALSLVIVLTLGNSLGHRFLQRFTHPGIALVQLRSDEVRLRRQGLEALLTKPVGGDRREIARAVTRALKDENEGVRARAIHVAGQLSLTSLINDLKPFLVSHSPLSFSALIALGLMSERDDLSNIRPHPEARRLISQMSRTQLPSLEPEAFAYALGLLRAPEHQTLIQIFETAGTDATRTAATWALSQLNDRRLLDFFTKAIAHESVSVQCAAIYGLETLAMPEAGPALMRRFEEMISCRGEGETRECEPLAQFDCPEVVLPVQEGGAARNIVKRREVLLSLVRAMAASEHPDLLTWLVKFQLKSQTNYRTWLFMSKVYDRMVKLDKEGRLGIIRKRLRQAELLKTVDGQHDDRHALPGKTSDGK